MPATIITDYPSTLHHERLRERGCDVTANRLAYFFVGARHAWHVPALNDQSIQNARGSLSERDASTAALIIFHHEGSNA